MKKKKNQLLENLISLIVEDGLEDPVEKTDSAEGDSAQEKEPVPEKVKFLETSILFTTKPPVDSAKWPNNTKLYLNPLKKGLIGADLVKATKSYFKYSERAGAAQYSERQFRIRLNGVFSFNATLEIKIANSNDRATVKIKRIEAKTPIGNKTVEEGLLEQIEPITIQGDYSSIVDYESEKQTRESLPDEETIKSTMDSALSQAKADEDLKSSTKQIIELIRSMITSGKTDLEFKDLKIDLDNYSDMNKIIDFAAEHKETTNDSELMDLIQSAFFKQEEKANIPPKQREVLDIVFKRVKNENDSAPNQGDMWKSWLDKTLVDPDERKEIVSAIEKLDDKDLKKRTSEARDTVLKIYNIIKQSGEKQESRLDLRKYLTKILVEAEEDKKEQQVKKEKNTSTGLITDISDSIGKWFDTPPSITAGSKKTVFEGNIFEFFETERASFEVESRKKVSNREFEFSGKIKCDGYLWIDARLESTKPAYTWSFRVHDQPSKPFLRKSYMI